MSHQHTNYIRPRLFRVFVTNRYWANRDEYDAVGAAAALYVRTVRKQQLDTATQRL